MERSAFGQENMGKFTGINRTLSMVVMLILGLLTSPTMASPARVNKLTIGAMLTLGLLTSTTMASPARGNKLTSAAIIEPQHLTQEVEVLQPDHQLFPSESRNELQGIIQWLDFLKGQQGDQRIKRHLNSNDLKLHGSLLSQQLIQPYMKQNGRRFKRQQPSQGFLNPQQQYLKNIGLPNILKNSPQDILNQQIADAATKSVAVPDPVSQAAKSAVMGAAAAMQLPIEIASTATMPLENWVLSKPKWGLGSPRWKYETTFWRLEGPQWVLDPETNQWELSPAAWRLEEGTWKLDGQQWVLNGPAWSLDLSNVI